MRPGIFRSLVLALIVGLFGFLSGVALTEAREAQRRRIPDTIDARRFRVVDENGTVRAELGMAFGAPALFLYDSKGKARAWVLLDSAGNARMMFVDAEDQPLWTAPPIPAEVPKPSQPTAP
ncbi:MAG: hypothetical protein RMK45_02440 [Armatimonadota bacterium]|nr:hypothetical protein [Armatimonadota bacterium]